MICYRLFVPVCHTLHAPMIVENLKRQIVTHAGGYTVYTAEGGWQDDDGVVHTEPVNVIEFLCTTSDEYFLKQLCVYVKTGLGQKCVLYTVSHTEARFV